MCSTRTQHITLPVRIMHDRDILYVSTFNLTPFAAGWTGTHTRKAQRLHFSTFYNVTRVNPGIASHTCNVSMSTRRVSS